MREDHDDTPVGQPLDTGSGASTGGSVRAKAARRGVNHGATVAMRIRASRRAERNVRIGSIQSNARVLNKKSRHCPSIPAFLSAGPPCMQRINHVGL